MSAPLRVLLTGSRGQLGRALLGSVPAGIEVIATSRESLDLADPRACREAVQAHRPDWVLNAGAYTAVDRAESEAELARAINVGAPQALAEALVDTGGRLLQLGTDFVFNGRQGTPYLPGQAADPLGVYGATKAEGERRAGDLLGSQKFCLLRTSWVYGPVGSNFCLTMLRLHRQKQAAGESLGVVADQVGCPTATHTLAQACWAAIQRELAGVLHWSDAGVASWYDFAVAIGEMGTQRGLLPAPAPVLPITTADYPTPARRPPYSLLECSASRARLALEPRHWRRALGQVLDQVTVPAPPLSP